MDPAGTGVGCSAVSSEQTASMTWQNTSQRDFWWRAVQVVAEHAYLVSFRGVEVIAFRVRLKTEKTVNGKNCMTKELSIRNKS